MTTTLRHGGAGWDTWDYVAPSRSVVARFRSGSLTIPICTERSPRDGAFFASRRGEHEWHVSPVMCVLTNDGWIGRNTPFDMDGVHCEFIALIGTPPSLEALMSELYIDDEVPTAKRLPTPWPSKG